MTRPYATHHLPPVARPNVHACRSHVRSRCGFRRRTVWGAIGAACIEHGGARGLNADAAADTEAQDDAGTAGGPTVAQGTVLHVTV